MENKKVCKMGLESIWVNGANGAIRMCGWTDYHIGNLVDNTIEDLWHGEKAQKFRESMLDGSYCYCNVTECPYIANNNLESITTEYVVPEYPKYVNLSYQKQCNYVCSCCRSERYIPGKDEENKYKIIEKELDKFINQVDTLASNGVGELFVSNHILHMLANIKPENDEIKIELESNGSLFNRNNWEKISNLGKYHLTVYITVHSFCEETYQLLSGTKLPIENMIDNLQFISELRQKGIINHFEIATVIQERNFREMPEFVNRCLSEFNPDRIRLRFFRPYGIQSHSIEWFFDVRNPYHPYYNEFKKIMENPVFDNPKVWKWQGETLSEEKRHPFFKVNRDYNVLSCMAQIDNFGGKMKQYLNENDIRTFSLYGNGGVGKAFASVLLRNNVDFEKIYDKRECGSGYKGHEVVRAKEEMLVEDAIIVTSAEYYEDISCRLNELNYKGKILNVEDVIYAM